jgi:hypothetical protein
MEPNHFFPQATPKPAKALKPTAGENPRLSQPALATSPAAVAHRAYAIYEQQGSQPGNEVKHWLEAEAQLFGGVERASQMHPGSSLFITEH